ncbi:MAG: S8 family serine peptidase [Omnitrophica bacterium]|nr:S8 family serine peptidase [Candidatus Omnitrophota bacterium]
MKTKMLLKPTALAIVILLLCSPVCFAFFKDVGDTETGGPQKPPGFIEVQYVPGEILVNFREGAAPQPALGAAGLKVKNVSRLHSIAPVIARFKKDYKLEADKNGWYWFRGKNYKASTDVADEEYFQEAYKDMSPEEKVLYRTYKITLPEEVSVEKAVASLQKNPDIEYAEPNYIAEALMVPDDPYYGSSASWGQNYDDLWGLKKLQCASAWNMTQGESIVVAVIDTGVQYDHEDLAQNMWVNAGEIPDNGIDDDENGYIDDVRGWDFVGVTYRKPQEDNDPADVFGHGTHCAGTIAGVGNNTLGVIGVAPQAKIMALKGLDDKGSGPYDALTRCVKYAADNGAKVTSNSWGGTGVSQALMDAFDYAHSLDCLSIAGAGNSDRDVAAFVPASYSNVMAIAASNHYDEKCSFSNYGTLIDVSAPGGGISNEFGGGSADLYNILSTMPDNSVIAEVVPDYKISSGYWRLAGTSMACPHAAGTAALARSRYPSLTNEEIRLKIQRSADDIGEPGKDIYFGHGRVNAYLTVLDYSVFITSPSDEAFTKGELEITGSAYIQAVKFVKYELFYAPKNDPENLTLLISSQTSVQDGILGVWDTLPGPDGKYIIILKVHTDDSVEITRVIDITVDNVNDPPVFAQVSDKGVVIGELFSFTVEAADPDDPQTAWGQLNYSVENLPVDAQFDPQTQSFSWQVNEGHKGSYEVTFKAHDSEHTVDQKVKLSTVAVEKTMISSTILNGNQGGNDIYGGKAVWINRGTSGSSDVFLQNLTTGTETRITDDAEIQSSPVIHKGKISYMTGNSYVYVYDLATKTQTRITHDTIYRSGVNIHNNKIVWYDIRNKNYDIYGYDLATGRETQITDNTANQYYPIIYGDRVVWRDDRNENSDIYMYEFSTGRETQLTNDTYNQYVPYVREDRVIWINKKDGNYSISLYDIPTGNKTEIAQGSVSHFRPAIYEDRVIWIGSEDKTQNYYKKHDLYMYNLSKGLQTKITDNNISSISTYNVPAIWQDTVLCNVGSALFTYRVIFIPDITSVSPVNASPGMFITIHGKGFGYAKGDSYVEFANGVVPEVFESWSDEEIICKVPPDALSGPLRVVSSAGASNTIDVTVLPAVSPAEPSALVAAAFSPAEINLTWQDNSDNEDGFTIERSPDGIVFAQIGQVSGNITTYHDPGLTPATVYYYRVRAYNIVQTSDYSNTASTSTFPADFLGVPSVLTASALSHQEIELNWQDNSAEEHGFKIERSLDGVSFTEVRTVDTNITTYLDAPLDPQTLYYYRIRAYNAEGNSGYSNIVFVTTPISPPQRPTGVVTAVFSGSKVDLSWQDNSDNEDGFRIERGLYDTPGSPIEFSQIAEPGPNETIFRDTGLEAGVIYYYRVYAYNTSGNSAYSNVAYVSTPLILIRITSPAPDSYISGSVDIIGTVFVKEGFREYELCSAPIEDVTNTTLINSSTSLVEDGLLGTWDTAPYADGRYILTGKVFSGSGSSPVMVTNIAVTVDKYSQPPVFLSLRNKGAVIGKTLTFIVEAFDPDDSETPQGQLAYSASNVPSGAYFDTETREFSWDVFESDKGRYSVTFIVSDNEHTVTRDITISTVAMQELQITYDPWNQSYPRIHKDKIVWQDSRDGNTDIYMYDLSIGQEIPITIDPINQLSPQIYEDRIVWQDDRNGNYDIYMYDLATGEEVPITTNSKEQSQPRIYNDKIVWYDRRNLSSDIYMYDITKNEEIKIASTTSPYMLYPHIYEDKIVWSVFYSDPIYLYDIATGNETRIVSSAGRKYSPLIYKDKIAWMEMRTQYYDIYLYDLSTSEKTRITSEPVHHNLAGFYADKIIWYTVNPNNSIKDVVLYDLTGDTETVIAQAAVDTVIGVPHLYEDKIALAKGETGNLDIYIADIIFIPEITSLDAYEVSEGTTLTITGNRFGFAERDSEVIFANDATASIQSWSDTEIICTVPQDAQSGLLTVVTLAGESNGINVAVSGSALPGDINADDKVDIADLVIVARVFSSVLGDSSWDERADIDSNNRVDITDLVIVARNFGRTK